MDRKAGDHYVIALVLSKNENPAADGRNHDVVHGGNPQLTAIYQMDREGTNGVACASLRTSSFIVLTSTLLRQVLMGKATGAVAAPKQYK